MIFDASALLALILNEEGAKKAKKHFSTMVMVPYNYAECGSTLINKGYKAEQALYALGSLNIELIEVNKSILNTAIALRAESRSLGLSLGDRLCLAAGKVNETPVLTADRSWEFFSKTIDLRFIR